ncbi:MAG: sigma-70 family RNA polymerase sigma factor [Mycobacterium sp.]
MTALPDWDIVSDAELACAAAAGDRRAFASIYDRYADRLHDFCIGMLRDRDAAADCVQDVFCAAATRLPQLREADKLRPWLYAIARNECLRCIRARGRERVYDEVPEAESGEAGPDTLAARSELASLIADAAGGLSDRDRSVLELAYRHGLEGPELAEALGVSAASAKKMTQRLRETIERSLGALLVSRRVRSNPSACPELGEILAGWDGQFSVLMRKRIARHIESCPVCDEERRRLVNPVALLGGVPVFIPAPAWLRERTLDQIPLTGNSAAMGSTDATESASATTEDEATELLQASGDGPADADADSKFLSRGALLSMALGALVLIVVGGLTIAWLQQRNAQFAPANISRSAPPPTTQMPRMFAPPPSSAPPSAAPSEVPVTTTIPAVTSLPQSTVVPPPITTTVPMAPPPPGQGPSSGTSRPPVFTPSSTPDEPSPPAQTETPTPPEQTAPPVTTKPPSTPTKTFTKTKLPTATVGPAAPPPTTQGPIIY